MLDKCNVILKDVKHCNFKGRQSQIYEYQGVSAVSYEYQGASGENRNIKGPQAATPLEACLKGYFF